MDDDEVVTDAKPERVEEEDGVVLDARGKPVINGWAVLLFVPSVCVTLFMLALRIMVVVAAASIVFMLRFVTTNKKALVYVVMGYSLMPVPANEVQLLNLAQFVGDTITDIYDFFRDLINPMLLCIDPVLQIVREFMAFVQAVVQRVVKQIADLNIFPWLRQQRALRVALENIKGVGAGANNNGTYDPEVLRVIHGIERKAHRETARADVFAFIQFLCDVIETTGEFIGAVWELFRTTVITLLDIFAPFFFDIIAGSFDVIFGIVFLMLDALLGIIDPKNCFHPVEVLPQGTFVCMCPYVYTSVAQVDPNIAGALLGCICPNAKFNSGQPIDDFLTDVIYPCLEQVELSFLVDTLEFLINACLTVINAIGVVVNSISGVISVINFFNDAVSNLLDEVQDFIDSLNPFDRAARGADDTALRTASALALTKSINQTLGVAHMAAAIAHAIAASAPRLLPLRSREPEVVDPDASAKIARYHADVRAMGERAQRALAKPAPTHWGSAWTNKTEQCDDDCARDIDTIAVQLRAIIGAMGDYMWSDERNLAAAHAALEGRNVSGGDLAHAIMRTGRRSRGETTHNMPGPLSLRVSARTGYLRGRVLDILDRGDVPREVLLAELDRIDRYYSDEELVARTSQTRFVIFAVGVVGIAALIFGFGIVCTGCCVAGPCIFCMIALLTALTFPMIIIGWPIFNSFAMAPLTTFFNSGVPVSVDPTMQIMVSVGSTLFLVATQGWDHFDFDAFADTFIDIALDTVDVAGMLIARFFMCGFPVPFPPITCPPEPQYTSEGAPMQTLPGYFFDMINCNPTQFCRSKLDCSGWAPCRCPYPDDTDVWYTSGTEDGRLCTGNGYENSTTTTGHCECWPYPWRGLGLPAFEITIDSSTTCADRGYVTGAEDIIIQQSDNIPLTIARHFYSTLIGLRQALGIAWTIQRLPPSGIIGGLLYPVPFIGRFGRAAALATFGSAIIARVCDSWGPPLRAWVEERTHLIGFLGDFFTLLQPFLEPTDAPLTDFACLGLMSPQFVATYGLMLLFVPYILSILVPVFLTGIALDALNLLLDITDAPLVIMGYLYRRAFRSDAKPEPEPELEPEV